ncbi:hypothetical protein H310_09497 [Aphanomyces invadans]|uniref:RNA methyltransferase n=1 Tax=Aphanomyces invadans TaxID=157072 RepID=A0A024TVE5_9STRA|nr:hypothetical protein H310_09497 [Aphanomyces invadans]ETV97601.1 hypothetical protein H310_09497 [Aphanomyces invadans]|eukprot:XP_008873810.1 hypothetical protein H310_09497 [Aphanomyces invadans]
MTSPALADALAVEHVFGNFHDYYDFNPESERLRFLTADLRRALRRLFQTQPHGYGTLLDVGCNEGKLTMGLYDALMSNTVTSSSTHAAAVFSTDCLAQLNDFLQPHRLRPEYITVADTGTAHRPQFVLHVYIYGAFFGEGRGVSKKVARARAATAALRHWCHIHQLPEATSHADFARPDTAAVSEDNTPDGFDLRVVGIDIDGTLIDRAATRWTNHPHVSFQTGDIMNPNEAADLCASILCPLPPPELPPRRFDVVTCFSITMWIHLNHGDVGLSSFLDTVSNLASHLIVEPQPWKCYRTAMSRLKRKGIKNPFAFQALKYTHNNVAMFIDAKLTESFGYKKMLGKTNWSRPVWLYSRDPLPGIVYDTTLNVATPKS